MKLTQLIGQGMGGEGMILADCIPKNNAFAGALAPVMQWIAGAFGGLLWPAAVMMIVIFAVVAVFMAKSDKAEGFIRAIGFIVMVVLGVMIALLVLTGVVGYIDSQCADPFVVSMILV